MRCLLYCAAALVLVTPLAAECATGDPQKMLVAHWTFDGAGGTCVDSSGNGNDASMAAGTLARATGLFGKALSLSGRHRLEARGRPDFKDIRKISLSAWVMPSAFERYNEIFRKDDGNDRVLFSFQENANVLSLGLNVGGYVECDAPIRPAQVLDGRWHHCAATFDGETMRVYLDGREIGSLPRAGRIRAGGRAPGCIGSSSGGECFQGLMDDLRIYSDALTPQEVKGLWESGRPLVEQYRRKRAKELLASREALRSLNIKGDSFSAMMANAREAVAASGARLADTTAREIIDIVKLSYPKELAEYNRLTGGGAARYLGGGDAANTSQLEKLVGAMSEYMPLTELQWKHLPAEDHARWKTVAALKDTLAGLKDRGAAARFSPDWIDIVLGAGGLDVVHERPRVREAVAPHIKPSTPETRTLTAAEARAALERDWIHQADGRPSAARIRDEMRWAREIADRLEADGVDLRGPRAELAALRDRVAQVQGTDAALYFRVREVKRRIMFANPAVDFDKVLFVDMPYPGGSEWKHETRHRLGYMARPGARLLVLEGLSPAGELRQIMPQEPLHGAFWRPDVSYDGTKVLFCFQPHNEKSYHIYEIGVDGSGLRQLTSGPYDDLDPIYLPDGEHIMVSTTRGHTYVRCMPPTNAYVLARADRDGRNIYLVSRNNEPDYLPSVMNDGRVIYTRWEYTDKPLWRAQGLWVVNPDGTQVNTLWGNQSVWPDLIKDARSIPGSRRIMMTGSAHHDWFAGSVGIIDPSKGFNFPDGITKVTADLKWPESGNGPVDPIESPRYHRSGRFDAYYSPHPLGEKDFIVSARRKGKFALYLMDVDGNRELIYEGHHHILHAIPVKARARPKLVPDLVEWPAPEERAAPKPGVIYSNNVYEDVPEKLKGRARHLRVLTIDHKTYTYWHKRPYLSTGPVVSGVQSEGVKRVLGTVPVERDGSVAFEAPSGIPLHFQLLDGEYRALQTMRSFTGVMPGERRGCVGCHELRSNAPQNITRSIAVSKAPSRITTPPWGEDTVSWARYVRPVLDRYCAKCHQGDGKGKAKVDMTPRRGHLGFDETYWLFTGKPAWGKRYRMPKDPPPGFGIADMIMVEGYDQRDPAGYATPEPMTKLSYRSRLVERVSSGKHHDVKVDEISRRKIIAWVDTMCPYRGDKEVREIDDPVFQGIDWLAIRPKVRSAPLIVRPGPVE
ncbi:MAG: LamG-like jellyroll fold domain-containing protein [Planctomycetota bacterium]|jgi:hypothetical protein